MKLKDFKNGWLVGDFSPSLLRTSLLEVGLKYISKNTNGDGHYHLKSDEFTIILSGKAEDKGIFYGPGDIIHLKKAEKNFTIFHEDTFILSIKTSSDVKDKYYE